MKAITVLMVCLAAVALHPAFAQDTASELEAVKRVVEGTASLTNAEKLDELMALYADDAKVESRTAGGIISKAQLRENMKGFFARRAVNRVDVSSLKATLADPTHATVDGVLYVHTASGNRAGGGQQWKLEKRDGQWLIVESKYK